MPRRKFDSPIGSTIQIWVVTRHQYGISALASQTSFGGETNDSVAKCWLFSQASMVSVKTESRNRRGSFPKSSKRIHIESATEYYFKVCTYPLLCSKSHKWKRMSITRGVICENTCKSKRLPMYAVFLFNNLMFKTTLKVSDLTVALSILYAAVALKVYMYVLIFFSTNTSLFQLFKHSIYYDNQIQSINCTLCWKAACSLTVSIGHRHVWMAGQVKEKINSFSIWNEFKSKILLNKFMLLVLPIIFKTIMKRHD